MSDTAENRFRIDGCFGREPVVVRITGDFPLGEPEEPDTLRPPGEVIYLVNDGDDYRVRVYAMGGGEMQDTTVEGRGIHVDCLSVTTPESCRARHTIECPQ